MNRLLVIHTVFSLLFVVFALVALILKIIDEYDNQIVVMAIYFHVRFFIASCVFYAVVSLVVASTYTTNLNTYARKTFSYNNMEERSHKAIMMQKTFIIVAVFIAIGAFVAVQLTNISGDFLLVQTQLAAFAAIGNTFLLPMKKENT